MRAILGITGGPGTGKKTVSPLVSSRLSYALLDLNTVATGNSTPQPGAAFEVDTVRLRKRIVTVQESNCVIFGHLLPDVFKAKELDFVAVLRCEPSTLKRRLLARGYAGAKLVENLEAELIGVVLDRCVRSFGESVVHEYDSTKTTPAHLARSIATDYTRGARRQGEWIDWTVRYASSVRLRSLLSFGRTEPAST